MNPLVIADSGRSAIGKTPAIKAVYFLLKAKGYKLLDELWQYVPGADIRAIFNVNGVKVGVESQGDPGCEMESTMVFFVESGCEIIVTACRTKGSTYDKVKDYLGRDNGFDILWLTHNIYYGEKADEVRAKFNKKYAQYVVRLIEERIVGVL